jgi:hypothetical protein
VKGQSNKVLHNNKSGLEKVANHHWIKRTLIDLHTDFLTLILYFRRYDKAIHFSNVIVAPKTPTPLRPRPSGRTVGIVTAYGLDD